jgi:hypothetical protein
VPRKSLSYAHHAAASRPAERGTAMSEYWYNIKTHEVEEDRLSDWSQLIGPYKTRKEAEHALEKVRARNEAWEKQDDDD